MKRLFTAALSAALLLSLALPSSAAGTGRAVDWALYTDITAQINGHPLRSYNVNGSTAVVAEDLRGYGFQVLWDAEDRTLSVERAADSTGCPALPASWPDYTPPALTQPVGTRAQPSCPRTLTPMWRAVCQELQHRRRDPDLVLRPGSLRCRFLRRGQPHRRADPRRSHADPVG